MELNKISKIAVPLMVLFFSCGSYAASLYVEKFGASGGTCTVKAPCDEIADAIAVATPNSRIIVGPGVYDGNFTINISGLKLESTAGHTATFILGQSANTAPVIDIQADKVAIGKKSKGFSILGEDVRLINIGYQGDLSCIGALPVTINNANIISGTKIEGNYLEQNVTQLLPDVDSYCDGGVASPAVLVNEPHLPVINVVGADITLNNNIIRGEGNIVVDAGITVRRSLIKDNQIFWRPEYLHSQGAIALRSSISTSNTRAGGVRLGAAANFSGNLVRHEISLNAFLSRGILALLPKAKLSNNVVFGFDESVLLFQDSSTVSKNALLEPLFTGVYSFDEKDTISDNTIQSPLANLGVLAGIIATDVKSIKGNNISSMRGPGLILQSNPSKTKLVKPNISNNNFYNVDSQNIGDCAIYFRDVTLSSYKLQKNFYGSLVELPLVLESSVSSNDTSNVVPFVGNAFNLCANDGVVDVNSSIIANISSKPSLKANKVKSLFKNTYF